LSLGKKGIISFGLLVTGLLNGILEGGKPISGSLFEAIE